MPTYEYQAVESSAGCEKCRDGFDIVQSIHDPKLAVCPECGAPIHRVICAPAIGRSQSGLDDRAKSAGFTKLKRISKGEYEKVY